MFWKEKNVMDPRFGRLLGTVLFSYFRRAKYFFTNRRIHFSVITMLSF